ncbi:hypothetical protein L207DRAFT_519195 [Hyaloscypha variabilis F]|uniref:Uncharacterized protein n=1 Tax=Hyaloscypha variabilis (strain UAMH 11265 / GT02V1 / F) TaxID=1149755 RepID=A0A2J6R068_HYAVF|nr:hypothetical protein L207DRAFT_519195 [Hyaloscypha variabilis F]
MDDFLTTIGIYPRPPLAPKQTDYLVNTLIPYAKKLVGAIENNPALLHPLINEQLIDNNFVHDTFLKILSTLPSRMTELVQQGKFVINDELPESRAANARTKSGKVPIVQVELRSELLDPDAIDTVISRVRTLLHEISHTIVVNNEFPIVDYCYAGGWAMGHLGPLYAENADTIAEASMFLPEDPGLKLVELADTPLEGSKWLFRTYNYAVAQRAVLREGKAICLSAALAWADLRVNRAWLRMADYKDFASRGDTGNGFTVEEMRRIEKQFLDWHIVGKRTGGGLFDFSGPGTKLDAASKGAVGLVSAAVEQVKGWVSGMQVRVKDGGAIDFIEVEPYKYRLQIPFHALQEDTPTLGNAILEKIFDTLPDASKLHKNITQTALLDLCVSNDRPLEQQRLGDRWIELLKTNPTPPKDLNALYHLDALLALAIVDSGVVFWKNVAAKYAIPKRAKWLRERGDASEVSTPVAKIEQQFAELDAAIGKLPQALDLEKADILNRRAKALDMLKLAIKTMADRAAVVLVADANKVKEWNDFSDRIRLLT